MGEEPIINNNMQQRTYVAIILDKSGSMELCKKITVSGFNEHVQVLMKEGYKAGETFASLVLFNENVEVEFFNAPVMALRELTEEAYVPNGGTAMYDAVGYTIARFEEETDIHDPNNAYLVILISDGEENSSKKWHPNDLAEKVQELQATNHWTFTYVGNSAAEFDLSEVQKILHTSPGNVYKGWFPEDDATSIQQMASGCAGLSNYIDERSMGNTTSTDYYHQQDD